jgi:hypothetical protein
VDAELAALRARIESLEARASDGSRAAAPPPPPAPEGEHRPSLLETSPWSRPWVRGFSVGGYIQAQYQHSQLSDDQLDTSGTPLNQDRFVVRRARLRVDHGWEHASTTIEVDGNNNNGLAFGLRRAEASVLLRASDPAAPPLVALTAGLFDIPFGYELSEWNRARVFMERTTASRAFFPGEPDFGARIAGAVGFLRYSVALLDGTPVPDSEPTAAGFDPTSEKDLAIRVGVDTKANDSLRVSGGASVLRGTGFHAGSITTKDSVQWRDLNGNGTVDAGELTAVPGHAATPSQTFDHWAIGADLQVRLHTPLGWGVAYGEVYVASNFDRGLFVADPVATGYDTRELGWYAALLQEITPYGVVGLRVDSYNPNLDSSAPLGGALLPTDQTVTTWSPLIGLVLPADHTRLVFEYDRVIDHLGLSPTGVPVDLRNDQWALRLQADL